MTEDPNLFLGYDDMNILFLLLSILTITSLLLWTVFLTTTGNLLWARICGKEIIEIESITGESWKSWVEYNPISRRKTSWRYPVSKIGRVVLNDDGTGKYILQGDIHWRAL